MIIHAPEIKPVCGRQRVIARVEFKTPNLCLPDRLWIEYPEGQLPATTADGFVTALFLVGMTLGEDLEVRGEVCPDLAYGLEQYQETIRDYYPQIFRRIDVRYQNLTRASHPSDDRTVCQTFSGGVDSFYTLRQHIPGGPLHPFMPVTHALIVHGFDVPLSNEGCFQSIFSVYEPLLRDVGVTLLPVRTNLREMTREVNWELSHGTALAAVGHGLAPRFRSLLVPSSYKYSEPVLWGSDPRLDHWLSSASMSLIHHGAQFARPEKLVQIADWKPVRDSLRVCWETPDGIRNCCRCLKCLLTMFALQITGSLDGCRTFPLPYEGRLMRKILYEGPATYRSAEIGCRLARRHGKHHLAKDVAAGLRRTHRIEIWKKMLR